MGFATTSTPKEAVLPYEEPLRGEPLLERSIGIQESFLPTRTFNAPINYHAFAPSFAVQMLPLYILPYRCHLYTCLYPAVLYFLVTPYRS